MPPSDADLPSIPQQGDLIRPSAGLFSVLRRPWVLVTTAATAAIAATFGVMFVRSGGSDGPSALPLGVIEFGDTRASIDLLPDGDDTAAVQAVIDKPGGIDSVQIMRGADGGALEYFEGGQRVSYGYLGGPVGTSRGQDGEVAWTQARCNEELVVRVYGHDDADTTVRRDVGIRFPDPGDCTSAELIAASELTGARNGRLQVNAADILR